MLGETLLRFWDLSYPASPQQSPHTDPTSAGQLKEIKMSRNRLFNVLVGIALAIVITLAVQETASTASIMTHTNSSEGVRTLDCASLPSRHSIHPEYADELGRSVIYTEDGRTGVDGGLIYLLSSYRACSPSGG